MLNSGIRSWWRLRYQGYHDLLLVRVRTNSNHTTQSQEVHCSLTYARPPEGELRTAGARSYFEIQDPGVHVMCSINKSAGGGSVIMWIS